MTRLKISFPKDEPRLMISSLLHLPDNIQLGHVNYKRMFFVVERIDDQTNSFHEEMKRAFSGATVTEDIQYESDGPTELQ